MCLNLFPPDDSTAGQPSSELSTWSNDLLIDFNKFQKRALASPKSVSRPRFYFQLWVVTDRAVRKTGLGLTINEKMTYN